MRFVNVVGMLVTALALVACGGGGGGGAAASAIGYDAYGSTSATVFSGLTVPDRSDCALASSGQANVVPICADSGPDPTRVSVLNQPFVTVTLCVPGSTSQCVYVDHMLVDTGSTGMRVVVSALSAPMPLPAVTNANGQAVAECYPFVSGWTWGSVNRADVYIGGLVARNVPIHMLGQPTSTNPTLGEAGAFASANVPLACSSNTGGDMGSVVHLGANGVLGLSTFTQDCTGCDTQPANNQYFVCPGGTCTSTALDTSGQPSHLGIYLGGLFSDGVVVSMATLAGTSTAYLPGNLTFGVGNIPSGTRQFVLDSQGQFTVTENGTTYTSGYIDSGSNAIFFDSGGVLPTCTTYPDFYCPGASQYISVTNSDTPNPDTDTVTIAINNLDTILSANPQANVVAGLAGPASSNATPITDPTFDWGFPFFIGRTVYVVRQNTLNGSAYGVIAYTPL